LSGSERQAAQHYDAARKTWQALLDKAQQEKIDNEWVNRTRDALAGNVPATPPTGREVYDDYGEYEARPRRSASFGEMRHNRAAVTIFASLPSRVANAQKPSQQPRQQAPRRGATIEIRGQVPTPQVVTVRPRETPAFSRRVLVPGIWITISGRRSCRHWTLCPRRERRSDTTSRSTADSTAVPAQRIVRLRAHLLLR
jgi:hypothetical protein